MLVDYLRNSKINVSNSEITKLKQEGYVVLKGHHIFGLT